MDEDQEVRQRKIQSVLAQLQGFLHEHLDSYALVGYTVEDKDRIMVVRATDDQQRDAVTQLLCIAHKEADHIIEGGTIESFDEDDEQQEA